MKGAYRVNENLMSYASYSRGYKAGGFNLDRSQFGPSDPTPFQPNLDTGFDPETVDAYEVGFKTNNAANSLFFNGAIFYQEYSDFQLNTFTGTSFIVTSVPGVISKGAEFDIRYLPEQLEGLTLQGGLVYAETQYDDFEAVDFLPRRVCREARFRSRPAGPERWPQLMRPRLSATGTLDSTCRAVSLHGIIQGRTSIRSRKLTIWLWSMRGWHSIVTIHRLSWRFGRRTCLTRTITSWLSIRPSRAMLPLKQRLEQLLVLSYRNP